MASARQDRLPAFRTRIAGAPRRTGHVSWRYAILPFLEDQTLYSSFEFDNGQLTDAAVGAIKSKIDVYQCPSTPGALRTVTGFTHRFGQRDITEAGAQDISASFVTVSFGTRNTEGRRGANTVHKVGAGAWYGEASVIGDRRRVSHENITPALPKRASLKWITDGLSKTMLLYEQCAKPDLYHASVSGKQRPRKATTLNRPRGAWVFPAEAHTLHLFDVDGLEPSINWDNQRNIFSFHRGAHTAFCDASVQFLSIDTSNEVLFSMSVRSDRASAQRGQTPPPPIGRR